MPYNEIGAFARDDCRAMSQLYRTELRATDRFGSSEGLPRFVVIVEIPDHIIATLGNPSSSRLQVKAYEVAMDATWRQRVNAPEFSFSRSVKFTAARHKSDRLWRRQFQGNGRLSRLDN